MKRLLLTLALAVVVHPCTQTRPAKIKPQHGNPPEVQGLRGLIHNFVVHGPGEKWMGMTDDGRERRILRRGGPQQRFQTACGTIDENTTMKYLGHEFMPGQRQNHRWVSDFLRILCGIVRPSVGHPSIPK